jgi:hypothetical protein
MKWSKIDISFGLEDHTEEELSNQNLPFMVMLLIKRHKVAKNLIDNRGFPQSYHEEDVHWDGPRSIRCYPSSWHVPWYHPKIVVHFHQMHRLGGIVRIRREQASRDPNIRSGKFNISYNCILGRPFLLRFMAVIHTAYATMNMPGPKGIITIQADQWDALACENTSLLYAGRFVDKAAQDEAAKAAKTQGGSAPYMTSTAKPSTSRTPRTTVWTTT